MVEEGAEFRGGNGKVASENIFAEKLKEGNARRIAQKPRSPHMPRRVPCVFIFFRIVDELSEKRRVQTLYIFYEMALYSSRQKFYCVGSFPKASRKLVYDFKRDVACFKPVGQKEYGDFGIALSYCA